MPEDTDYALAWQVLEREKCPDCGEPHTESMTPGSDDAYTVTALRCFGCKAKARAADGFDDRDGLYFVVKRTKEVDGG